MGSKVFRTVIERKIDIFISTFGSDSISIFKNNDNKLIHPAEYGVYRERCLKNLIGFILDKDLTIADGFLITATDSVSTQCDVIVYESNIIPLIDNEIAKFFPVEVVKSIGEIKSDLSRSNFKDALIKLAKNKMLFEKRSGTIKTTSSKFGEYTYPFSFLVCKKINFDIAEIDFNSIYDGIDRKYWHNSILSVEDGLLSYMFSFDKYSDNARKILSKQKANFNSAPFIYSHPLHIFNVPNILCETYKTDVKYIKSNIDSPYAHILDFLTILQGELPLIKTYKFDFVTYLDLGRGDLFL